MHLFSRHDLEPVPKIPMLQTLVTNSSQSQQINISKRFNVLWKSVMKCTFLRCKSIPEKVSPSHIIHFRANWHLLNGNQFCLFKVIFKLMQLFLFIILTNMRTHLSKCSCNQIRQDGTILPRNSKIETILLFHYMFISSQLWLTSHPKSTVVLLGTGTPNTSREIYSEDANGETGTLNPLVITDALAIGLNSSKDIAVRNQLNKLNSFPAIAFELFSSVARALGL